MAASHQVARQAWHVVVHVTRTHLYSHMDFLHAMAMFHWRAYDGNKDGHDIGPFELNEVDWYVRHKEWGHWLRAGNIWATKSVAELDRLVADLGKLCALGNLLFKGDKESAMDETLYIAVEETKDLLRCYINGWKVTVSNMSLDAWCSFGENVMFPRGWEEWYRTLGATDPIILLRHAVNGGPL